MKKKIVILFYEIGLVENAPMPSSSSKCNYIKVRVNTRP